MITVSWTPFSPKTREQHDAWVARLNAKAQAQAEQDERTRQNCYAIMDMGFAVTLGSTSSIGDDYIAWRRDPANPEEWIRSVRATSTARLLAKVRAMHARYGYGGLDGEGLFCGQRDRAIRAGQHVVEAR